MTEVVFDHDRLDVYRLAIEYTADSFDLVKDLNGIYRHARDQWYYSYLRLWLDEPRFIDDHGADMVVSIAGNSSFVGD